MVVHVRLVGTDGSMELLGQMLAPGQPTPLLKDEVGWWLLIDVPSRRALHSAITGLQDHLDLANGAMHLWANSRDRLEVKGVSYVDPETGRSSGLLLNAYSVVAPFAPAALARPSSTGLPLGAAALAAAATNQGVARALSVLAAGGSEWWQLYILLEILRDSLGERRGRRTGSWAEAFRKLAERYGETGDRLESLKQTVNYHRHFSADLPELPWEHSKAAQFIRQAVRDWIEDQLL